MIDPIPDWKLPPGINRPLWDYLHDAELARTCDDRLAGTPLLEIDRQFVARHSPGPGRLIDLGCGTGRLLIPLAREGWKAVGVDLSPHMLRAAAEKAAAAGVTIDLLQANIVELDMLAERSFSCAVCLFSTLGMIVGSAERRRVIDHVVRLLRPGGVFVLHVHNRWFNVWDRGGRRWLIADLFRPLLGQEPGNRTGAGGLTLHHFTRSEAEQLVQTAGLEIVEVQPVSIRGDGRLPLPGWFAWLRAYGYLLAARRPLIDLPADAAG